MLNPLICRAVVPVMLLSAASAMAQTVRQPAYVAGDTWTHRTVDDWTSKIRSESTIAVIGVMEEFMRVSGESTSYATNGTPTNSPASEYTQRANLDLAYSFGGKVTTRVNYAWPLTVGKQWTYQYVVPDTSSTLPTSPSTTFTVKAEAVRWEEVQVPAGKFQAIKVVHNGTWESPSSTGRLTWTYWFAPSVKRHVKYQGQTFLADGSPSLRETSELISYTVK